MIFPFYSRSGSNQPVEGTCPGHLIMIQLSSGAYVTGNHDATQQNLIIFRETPLLVMENCSQSFSLQIIGWSGTHLKDSSWSGIVLNSPLCLRIRNGYREKFYKMILFLIFLITYFSQTVSLHQSHFIRRNLALSLRLPRANLYHDNSQYGFPMLSIRGLTKQIGGLCAVYGVDLSLGDI